MNNKEILTKIIFVDKDLARNFLNMNSKNRSLNKYRVKKYAEQMANGEWEMNGESIIIGAGNELLDGQHRLAAIFEFDLKIPLLFCFGVDPRTFDTIDTGDSRSRADVLTISGIQKGTAQTLSVCVKLDMLMKHTGSISSQQKMQSKVTPKAILKAIEIEPKYLEAVEFIEQFGRKNLPLPASALSFLTYRFFRLKRQFSEEWLRGLVSGVGIIEQNDMRAWVRNMIWRETNRSQKRPLRHKVGIVIRAWYLASKGRQIKHECNLYRDPMEAYKYLALEDDLFGM
jgi:hypothetical protein